LINNLPHHYNPNSGEVSGNSQTGYFNNSNCTGTQYLFRFPTEINDRFSAADPFYSDVFNASGSRINGEVRLLAVRPNGDTLPWTTQMYIQRSGDICRADQDGYNTEPSEGAWYPTVSVGSIYDAIGPLRIGN
jgi:hypothetical protein